jgi:protein-disulfide isomerase
MHLTRRLLLVASASVAAAGVPRFARAGDAERMTERALGDPKAKVLVQEWFSLTCTHCAHFSMTTFPDVKAKLIDTGRIRYVFRDFPLDQVALVAAQVARALPPERYEPFCSALFASQDRWAFARGVNSTDELWKMAALAGMSRDTFDSAIADQALRAFILKGQEEATQKWKVDSTPTFIVNGKKEAGALDFDAFDKLVSSAA